MNNITRKEFLQSLAMAGTAAVFSSFGGTDLMAQGATAGGYDLAAVMGGEPDAMFNAAIAQMGGMKRFVKPGMKVTVKPNIGWDRPPEIAANTNPKLVEAIIKACQAAGASEISVFDHTCDQWRKCYQSSGIEEVVKKLGAKMVPGNEEGYYREIELPNGKNMKKAKVHQAILDSDIWINCPVLKHHCGANLTMCMKNHMGIVWDRGFMHGHNLQQTIADICTLKPGAVLNILDAYRIMLFNGPQRGSKDDIKMAKALFMGTDIVAVDTMGAKFYGQFTEMPLDSVGHLANGENLGLGKMNPDPNAIKKIKMK